MHQASRKKFDINTLSWFLSLVFAGPCIQYVATTFIWPKSKDADAALWRSFPQPLCRKRLDHVMSPSLSLGLDPENHRESQAARPKPKMAQDAKTKPNLNAWVHTVCRLVHKQFLVVNGSCDICSWLQGPSKLPGLSSTWTCASVTSWPSYREEITAPIGRGLFNFQMDATQHHQMYYNISSSNSKLGTCLLNHQFTVYSPFHLNTSHLSPASLVFHMQLSSTQALSCPLFRKSWTTKPWWAKGGKCTCAKAHSCGDTVILFGHDLCSWKLTNEVYSVFWFLTSLTMETET